MDLTPLDRGFDTERFVLRPLDATHLHGLSAVHGDDAVTRFLPSATWRSVDDANAWLARNVAMQDEGRSRRWVVVDRTDGRPVGDCMLFNFDAVAARAEIGFALGRADWGRGAMREAGDALLAAAFDELRLRRVEAFADPRNTASGRLLTSLGFACEGTLRERAVLKGEVCDSNVYGLLRDAWSAAGRRDGVTVERAAERSSSVTVDRPTGGSSGR